MDYKMIPGDKLAKVSEIHDSEAWKIFHELFNEEYEKTVQLQINTTVLKNVDDAIAFNFMQGRLSGMKQVFTFMDQLYDEICRRSCKR